ncbi:MAG: hypothetical protein KC535_03910 [Nanoarchaeota archaeon]|nr:hypothetical protein [Nanoarchaeota archaeon]
MSIFDEKALDENNLEEKEQELLNAAKHINEIVETIEFDVIRVSRVNQKMNPNTRDPMHMRIGERYTPPTTGYSITAFIEVESEDSPITQLAFYGSTITKAGDRIFAKVPLGEKHKTPFFYKNMIKQFGETYYTSRKPLTQEEAISIEIKKCKYEEDVDYSINAITYGVKP